MRLIRWHSEFFGHSVSRLTWKAFRAGHATQLALKGAPISNILAAGEWKSKTLPMYIDDDTIDAAEFLNTALDNSENQCDD